MEVVKPTLEDIQQPKTLPAALTREQKRMLEKIELEAQEVFQKLSAKFLVQFMDASSPESDEFKEIANVLDSQWRTYVKRRKLDPKAQIALRLYITDTFLEYLESKKEVT